MRFVHLRLACATVCVFLFTVSSGYARQLPAPDETGWLVAYDHLDSLFERSLSGRLEIEDEHLRFRAINRQVAWDVPLEDVISIKTEEVTNPLRVRVRSIVIESREGNNDVRRRIAPIDDQLQFVHPVVLSGLMKDRWKQVMDLRRAVRQ
jgi:hypothetical protein